MRAFWRSLALALTYLAVIAGTAALAAQVSTQPRSGYQRLMFAFDAEAQLTTRSNGNTLVLQFNQPLGPSANALASQLAGYATGASLSADGKTLTLTLTKPFRTRQFKSGTSVGLDLIGAPDSAAPAPEDTILTTKAAPEVKKPEPAPVEKPPTKVPFAKAEKPKPPGKPVAAPVAPVTEAMLTTKPAETEAPVATPEAKPEPKPEPAPEPVLSTKPAPQEPVPAPAPVAEAAPAAPSAPEKPAPLLVTAKAATHGVTLHFPWTTRTAAAVFERARDVWVIFSNPADANAGLLRTVMPKGVADVRQFRLGNATVLRIATDGTVRATASQPSGSFAWDVTLATSASPTTLDTAITNEADDSGRELVIGAFDSSTPLKFVDPRIGDMLVVVPTFEVGRGVANAKQFAELSVLATGQGVVLASSRADLTLTQNRAGVVVRAPGGLAISENLTTLTEQAKPAPGASTASDVMLPYDKWYVAADQFDDMHNVLLGALATASPSARPEAMMRLVSLYLGQGLGAEAFGYLELIRAQYPDYYTSNKLALLSTVTAYMKHDDLTARQFVAMPELNELSEAELWREVVGLYAPAQNTVQKVEQSVETPAAAPATTPEALKVDDDLESAVKTTQPMPQIAHPTFRFLKWNKPYIRFYPPRIRQRLAIEAADAYLRDGLDDKALQVYETLNRDGILSPIKRHAELTLAEVAVHHNETQKAQDIYAELIKQTDDPYIATRARFGDTMLRYRMGTLTLDDTAEALERLRMGWRGDALAHDILTAMAQLYRDGKRYDDSLRTLRILVDDYPSAPDVLQISADTSQLFQDVFLGGLADDMPPLKALALFYEFQDLTPVGERGDEIIQRLADRMAGVDLLDRAIALLDHQVKNRVSGEARARVGARLALLQLLNQQPQPALDTLQATNFGTTQSDLQIERQELSAEALSKLGKHTEALSMLYNDNTHKGALLRLDILWAMRDWPNVINRAEDILSARPSLTALLNEQETSVLMKLALAYAFEGNSNQLRYLRDYFTDLLPDSGYKEAFTYITNDTNPLDTDDISLITQQISNNESFLKDFRDKIANGKLSEAIK